MADAGYRWRIWINNNRERFPNGAFSDCNFIMMNLPPDRIEQLASVLICGGGEMNKIDMTTSTVAEIKSSQLQYCFTELKKPMKADIKKKLTDSGVKILALNQIFHYLVSKEMPSGI